MMVGTHGRTKRTRIEVNDMDIYGKRRGWNAALDASLRLEEDVLEIPGMREAKNVRDPMERMEKMLDASIMEVERMKWLNALVFQEAARTNRFSLLVMAVSCMMDVGIIAFHLGLI